MKHIITIIAFLLTGLAASAQTDYHADITGLDTLTDTEADTSILTITGSKSAITFQTNVTKISGTVAGTIVVQGTIDTTASPTRWVTLETDSLSDATAVYSTTLTANNWKKYRVIRTGSGTQSSSHRTFVLYRR